MSTAPSRSEVRPRLLSHVDITSETLRRQLWYRLHDRLTGQHLRLNASAYALVQRLDGRRSVDDIRTELQRLGLALTDVELSDILAQLHRSGMLGGLPLVADASAVTSPRSRSRWLNPLSVRLPLWNPDRFLNRVLPCLPGRSGLPGSLWTLGLLLLLAGVGAIANRAELSLAVAELFNRPGVLLLLLWLVYPPLKAAHELAHALVLKVYGGTVRECGITLLVLTPVPYVDASDSWRLQRRERAVVCAAGIAVELAIASMAMVVWWLVQPGLVRDLALCYALVGSLSTVLFNANPLLKFDGYYLLQDLLATPNLHSRASRFWGRLCRRWLLRLDDISPMSCAPGEQRWLAVYGAAAFLYRHVILLAIAYWLTGRFLFAGVALAVWVLVLQYGVPLFRLTRRLYAGDLRPHRRRVLVAGCGWLSLLVVLLGLVPMPSITRVEGVIGSPTQSQVYAPNVGWVGSVLVQPGAVVQRGDPLLVLVQPELDKHVAVLGARLRALELTAAAEQANSRVGHARVLEDVRATRIELERFRARQQELTVRSATGGQFVGAREGALLGQYFAEGDLIGQVIDRSRLLVRVVLPPDRIGRLRDGVEYADIRLAERFDELVQAAVTREIPSANFQLPGAALGSLGGGGITIAADDPEGLRTVDRVFHLELALPAAVPVTGIGQRVYVRLHHAAQPLARRWLIATRQLLLNRLPAGAV